VVAERLARAEGPRDFVFLYPSSQSTGKVLKKN